MADESGSDYLSTLFPLPVDETRLKLLFYSGLFLYVGSHLALATDWEWENKLFPFLVGIPILALIAVNMLFVWKPALREFFTTDEGGDSRMAEALSSSDDGRPKAERHRSEAGIVLWSVALPIYIYLVGFAYALPTYVFAFVLYYTRDLKKAVVSTAAFTAFSYVVFVVLLNLRMYHGVLPLPRFLEYLPS